MALLTDKNGNVLTQNGNPIFVDDLNSLLSNNQKLFWGRPGMWNTDANGINTWINQFVAGASNEDATQSTDSSKPQVETDVINGKDAVSFEGDDYLKANTGIGDTVRNNKNVAYSMLIRFDDGAPADPETIVSSNDDSGNESFEFFLLPGGSFRAKFRANSPSAYNLDSAATLSDGGPSNVVIVSAMLDRQNSKLRIFFNGTEDNNMDLDEPDDLSNDFTGEQNLFIGARNSSTELPANSDNVELVAYKEITKTDITDTVEPELDKTAGGIILP